jgi:hypothetical protein
MDMANRKQALQFKLNNVYKVNGNYNSGVKKLLMMKRVNGMVVSAQDERNNEITSAHKIRVAKYRDH